MTSVRYVIEQFPSGLVESSARYRTARLSVLSSKWVRCCFFHCFFSLFLFKYFYTCQSYINSFNGAFFFVVDKHRIKHVYFVKLHI